MRSVPVSSIFVGRAAELAQLTLAAAAAEQGAGQSVLVRGEAGVGKTRLVEEFVRNLAPEQAVAAFGNCFDGGADVLPFAPFTAALRSLWRRLPDEVGAASLGREDLLARIVPDVAVPAVSRWRDDDSSALFALIAQILEQLAANRLLVLIIEDLHWADVSTRRLLEFLFRTPHTGRLLIIATYRSDGIPRQHPLRPFLAEIDRLRSVRRIELDRFDRVEVTKLLTGILRASPDPAILNEIFARSDGNAFFVEELARLYHEHTGAGLDDLHDVLLARVDSLPEAGQRIARVASQSGPLISYPLLRAVAGFAEDELIEALRAVLLAQILVAEPDGTAYRFRHSLMREAVSASLLAGERVLINQRYGEALEAEPSLVPAEELISRLAQHWYAAHDHVKALRMSVAAADAAGCRYAYAEQRELLERALELWDQVPAEARHALPAIPLPTDFPTQDEGTRGSAPGRTDLLAAAVIAARRGGNLDRALHLARLALKHLSGEPEKRARRAAWFWVQRSLVVQDLNQGDGWRELQTAQGLVRHLPSSTMHAALLTYLANWSARHRPGPESLAIAERAVHRTTSIGNEELELRARITRCWLRAESDLDGTNVAELYEVRERAEKLGVADIIGQVNQNLPSTLEGMGRSDEAIVAARHSIDVCRSLGLPNREAWARLNLSLSLFSVGRWSESDEELDEAAAVAWSYKSRGALAGRRAFSLLARGDVERAAEQVTLARELLGTGDLQPQFLVAMSHCDMAVAAGQGRVADARMEFLRADAKGLTTGPIRYSLPMLCDAASMEGDARRSTAPDERSAAVLTAVRRAVSRLDIVFPISRAFETLLWAEVRRAEGTDDPARWTAAVAAFEPLGRPYELAVALLGEGRALAGNHQLRNTALARLARAHEIASSLGATRLLASIAALTGHAEVPTRTETPPTGQPTAEPPTDELVAFGLTPRETEVLRLVARGYRNRRIAEELYISQKTASLHVSNILAKLGAASRTEAAAIAHRHGLPLTE
ncbi:AAA family ATPase [Micromonospora sp. NPDC049559]|uniref:helix-turn-helix transcriptional regulator n=1 Tax=Micromonospora sp. NPDC049559 TaxID=3155923 RepID=UPI003435A686